VYTFKETGNLQRKILFAWGGHFQFIPDVMKKKIWVQLFEIVLNNYLNVNTMCIRIYL
jgi:hypothetical protein